MDSLTPIHSTLPAQPTSFIGRKDEIVAIDALLHKPECRLLTLLGPGGMGKTRLAIEVGRRKQHDFADGVSFVALQPLASPTGIVPAIASAVGYEFQSDGRDPSKQLLDYLGGKQVLLLMDNVEHLLEGVAYLGLLLQVAPLLKIVATSREALNLREEWLWLVRGLQLPDGSDVSVSDAVQLFAERSRRVNQLFVLSNEVKGVIRICRLVGGMPLAIELASSWCKTLSANEIASEIECGMELLETSLRNVPERHRSTRAVFEGSWQLLSKGERRVFRRMAVFHGGCTRQAALAVTGADPWTLQALTDKSFIYRDPTTGRYLTHELLHHYGQERLAETGEGQIVGDAHLNHYVAMLERCEAALKNHRRPEALNELQVELDNIRAAWNWALHQGNVEAIDHMVNALTRFSVIRGRQSEGAEFLQQALNQLPVKPSEQLSRLHAKLQTRLATISSERGHSDKQEALLRDNLTLATRYNDKAEMAICLRSLSWLFAGKRLAEALHLAVQSLVLFTEISDRWEMARTHITIGFIHAGLGDVDAAMKHAGEAYSLFHDVGEAAGMAHAMVDLGFAAAARGNWEAHDRHQREALALARKSSSPARLVWVLGSLATSAIFQGQFEEARRQANECFKLATEINSPLAIAASLLVLSELANVSVNTVKTHLKNLYAKLGVSSRTQAVHRAQELGLL